MYDYASVLTETCLLSDKSFQDHFGKSHLVGKTFDPN